MDAGLCFLMISRNQAFYLPSGVWISIGTFVWEKGENILPLCWFAIVCGRFRISGLDWNFEEFRTHRIR